MSEKKFKLKVWHENVKLTEEDFEQIEKVLFTPEYLDKKQSVLAESKAALKEALARLFEEEEEIPEDRWREFLK